MREKNYDDDDAGNNLDDQSRREGPQSEGQFNAHTRFQNEESTEKESM